MRKSYFSFQPSQQNYLQDQQSEDFNVELQDQYKISGNQNFEEKMNLLKFKKQEQKVISWTVQDEKQLINLHKRLGNKWTLLSKNFPGCCQNFIKNHFYSRLRKGIRKLNKCISACLPRKYNKFNLNIIFKLSNISEKKVIGKCNITDQITSYYKEFVYRMIDFSDNQDIKIDYQLNQEAIAEVQSLALSLIALENLFRIISGERIYKGKKKNIAYLKKFAFKLSSQTEKTLVITKENCYISEYFLESQNLPQKVSELMEIQQKTESNKILQNSTKAFNNLNPSKQLQSSSTIEMPSSECFDHNEIVSNTDDSYLETHSNPLLLNSEELIQIEAPIQVGQMEQYQNLLDKYGGDLFFYFEM